MAKLKVFTHKWFSGTERTGGGTAAIVLATNKKTAKTALEKELKDLQLPQKIDPDDFVEVDLKVPAAIVLSAL